MHEKSNLYDDSDIGTLQGGGEGQGTTFLEILQKIHTYKQEIQ